MSVHMWVQATLPSKPGIKNSTFKPYMWGVALAYAAIAYCYFCVAFAGYWAFGNEVKSNIMLSVNHPSWLVGVANLLVVIHVFGSYQVFTLFLHTAAAVGIARRFPRQVCGPQSDLAGSKKGKSVLHA